MRRGRGSSNFSEMLDEFWSWVGGNKVSLILALIANLAIFCVSVMLSYEDYSTSVAGYRLIPTAKVHPSFIPFIGLLPQLLQIGLGYSYLQRAGRWAGYIVLVAFSIDFLTDVYYKASATGWSFIGIAISSLESLFLFTLGSEILLVASIIGIVHTLKEMNEYRD